MTPSYQKIIDRIAENNKNNNLTLAETIERNTERTHEQITELTRRTMEFVTTGVANIADFYCGVRVHGIGWGHHGFSAAMYFRYLSKELGRPFVWSTGQRLTHWDSARSQHIRVASRVGIPNRKYLSVLTASLALYPEEMVRVGYKDTVCTMYVFHNEEVYKDWRKRCVEDPDFRKALRLDRALPQKVSE